MHIIRNTDGSIIRLRDAKPDDDGETWWTLEKIVVRDDAEACKCIKIRLTAQEIERIAQITQGNFIEGLE